uniref:Fucosyltransferase n=1 Tax=Acrobeloides nanus TaxID=290746 RepID=A0A914CDC5_9BILA
MNMSTLNGTLPSCHYQCIYTDDRRFEPYASAIVFHIPDLNPLSLPKRRPDVLHVFFIEESAAWRWSWWTFSYKFVPKNYFNLTKTYRKDSDIFASYGAFYPIENTTKKSDIWSQSDINAAMLKKSSPILFLVSDCNTHSKRELYVEELAKYINITQFGKCADKFCDANCEEEQIKKHYFYLAFENSVCKDYVTEKFWRLKKLIVPIVLDRKIVENTIPSDVFIAASDFKDPSKLAEYLQYLMQNPNEYARYLNWTKKFQKSYKEPPRENRLCKLCEMVHKNVHNEIPNIQKWWVHGSDCLKDYAKYLLKES